MNTLKIATPKYIRMKSDPRTDEAWLQDVLAEQPELLGLGELEVRERERVQPGAGRLDLLLSDPETLTRYEVEVQLGPLDESHIVRTIEYWDLERQRFPHYDHIAVIAAEDITSRFHNVISLIGGSVPLIAIELQCIELNGAVTLIATQVVKLKQRGTEEEDAGETIDRSSWETKASKATLKIADGLVSFLNELQLGGTSDYQMRYNKHYIAVEFDGKSRGFLTMKPRKSEFAIAEFKLPLDDEFTVQLESGGMDMMSYDKTWKQYRVRIRKDDLSDKREALEMLMKRSHEHYFG